MAKMRLALIGLVIIGLAAASLFPASAQAAKKLYVGGTYALTGAYAEDTAAALAANEDYIKYVNETKKLAPWRREKFPADISLEVMWRDDELKPPKALTIYEELKAKGMLVFRVSGSPQALALRDRLHEDRIGAVSMASGSYLLKQPKTIFPHYPIYTDSSAAIAEWFLGNWKEARKPRVAYLTADNAMGRSVIVPELTSYLKEVGYDFVGSQFVPLVPTTPPTTQLLWLKKNKVDLTCGVMIDPGSQPTIKEAVRLDMGPHLGHKITFGFATPTHLEVMIRAMGGKLSEGVVVAGDFPPRDDPGLGMKFLHELQDKYRPDKKIIHTIYVQGMLESMIQVEALRLALQKVPFDKLKPVDVLEQGFHRIKNLDTGGLSNTPLTYGKGDVEGIDGVRVDQVQKGKIVKQGTWPCRHLY